MITLDDEIAAEYLAECREHLATVETDLLAMEEGGAKVDDEVVNRAFRSLHSIKGGAGFFELVKVRELAHRAEDALALIRCHKMAPTPERVRVLLGATDRLRELIQDPRGSNQADIAEVVAALARLSDPPAGHESAGGPGPHDDLSGGESVAKEAPRRAQRLRMLLAEDDFACRLLLQTFLSRYGECHVAVTGKEAVEAFRSAYERGQTYDLICMDIMMPEMDGREAVRQIRAVEESWGILSTAGATIIMVTALDEMKEVFHCFQELCDAYVIKPVDLDELLGHMRSYNLVP
jgi:CheY-like chemotaxis protein/HPt (histidine-containing phosphotransfer) domain-containing protein